MSTASADFRLVKKTYLSSESPHIKNMQLCYMFKEKMKKVSSYSCIFIILGMKNKGIYTSITFNIYLTNIYI